MIIEIIDGMPYKVIDGKCRDCALRTGATGVCMSAKACSRSGFSICYAALDAADLDVVFAAVMKARQS